MPFERAAKSVLRQGRINVASRSRSSVGGGQTGSVAGANDWSDGGLFGDLQSGRASVLPSWFRN